jgi:putative sigma-54 modulation protein
MKIAITGRGIELTDGLKEAVTAKLSKLDRFFTPDTRANVTLSVEKERQKIEVTIPVKGHTIRAEEASDDMYTSINEVEEVIERQLRRYRTRIIDKAQDGPKSADDVAYFSSEFMDSGEEAFEEEDADIVSGDIRITRTKHFGLKPMYPEDACIEMELLGHNFFVFRNAETDEVNVVYKRKKQNTYGLIEPDF